MIVYEGPSELDGSPIVGIITGLKKTSTNTKTGNMAQLWILRSDMDPLEASRTGADSAICGDCPFRGAPTDRTNGVASGRECYVALQNAPLSVYKRYKRGGYEQATVQELAGINLRLGAYGDPAALPYDIVRMLTRMAGNHTGYTHQWARIHPRWSEFLMASVEDDSTAQRADFLGYRLFRVQRVGEPSLPSRDWVTCPASEEGGKRTTCEECGLCAGQMINAKSVTIIDHGPQRKRQAIKERVGI